MRLSQTKCLATYSPPLGSEIELRAQFREFCRLEIGKKWYLISDQKPWRLHGKLKKIWDPAIDDWDKNGAPSIIKGKNGAPDIIEGHIDLLPKS